MNGWVKKKKPTEMLTTLSPKMKTINISVLVLELGSIINCLTNCAEIYIWNEVFVKLAWDCIYRITRKTHAHAPTNAPCKPTLLDH